MSINIVLQLASVSLACGLIAGWVMHRADFCLAGMFRDFFLFGETVRLRALFLAVIATMFGTGLLGHLGLLPFPPPFFGSPTLATFFGGFLFGTGMVLAGGCVIGTLYRMGAGSFPSLLAFVGLLAGSTLYAEIHPWWSSVARATTSTWPSTLPVVLGLPLRTVLFAVSASSWLLVLHWFHQGKMSVPTTLPGYLQPWRAALLLAVASLASWLLVGMPLGITTTYAKLGAMAEQIIWPEHLAHLAFFRVESLAYTPPFASETIRGGPGPAWDGVAVIQLPLIAGVVLGSAASAIHLGEWRLHLRLPWRQACSALLGGLIMGLAARMAPACNVWHLLGGLPILASQSLVFLGGLLPGAWLGGRLLTRWVVPPTSG